MEQALRSLFFDACSNAIKWGPGMLIALAMLYGLYRLLKNVGLKIVSALEKPTQALTMQAQSMDRLTGSIQDYVHRDANEHKEIIILQKVNADMLREIRNQLDQMSGGK